MKKIKVYYSDYYDCNKKLDEIINGKESKEITAMKIFKKLKEIEKMKGNKND